MSSIRILASIPEMKACRSEAGARGKSVGFVPTMGFLHEGHLSLVRASIRDADFTVVSIFVNPAQFAPHEDFEDYPRDMERDLDLLRAEGVDAVFAPLRDSLYPEDYFTYVEAQGLQERLCGQSRPHFFRGVCTIVLKLFHIVEPDMAFFGQKDAQQSIIIRRMVKDLNLDVRIVVCPIVRDPDGLALSSRNAYLDAAQRKAGLCLSRSLDLARAMISNGERDAGRLISIVRQNIEAEPQAKIDYVEIVDTEELLPVKIVQEGYLIALAAYIGGVRLIDNLIV